MDESGSMSGLKAIALIICLWVCAYFVTFGGNNEKRYEEEGITVYATIIEIDTGIRRGSKSYRCTYINAEGNTVEADLILNKFSASLGDVVEGKYLPDIPGEVYCAPSKLLKYGLMIFIDGLAIMLTVFFVYALFSKE